MKLNMTTCKRLFVLACAAAITLSSCSREVSITTYEELLEILDDASAMEKTTLVDIRDSDAWNSGYIAGYVLNTINIPYDDVVAPDGTLIGSGAAITSIITSRTRRLIVYGSDNESALLFAGMASELGYPFVSCYAGGVADWKEHGNYLTLSYEGFKRWYDAACPLSGGDRYLIDVHPYDLYVDYGHIAGAINITGPTFGDDAFLDNLAGTVADSSAETVFYCIGVNWPASRKAAREAVTAGYVNTFAFVGGHREWQDEGNVLIQGPDEGFCSDNSSIWCRRDLFKYETTI